MVIRKTVLWLWDQIREISSQPSRCGGVGVPRSDRGLEKLAGKILCVAFCNWLYKFRERIKCDQEFWQRKLSRFYVTVIVWRHQNARRSHGAELKIAHKSFGSVVMTDSQLWYMSDNGEISAVNHNSVIFYCVLCIMLRNFSVFFVKKPLSGTSWKMVTYNTVVYGGTRWRSG
jgi:hypothetical protein